MSKVYYANSINLSGLYSKHPVKCWKYSDTLHTYWDSTGDFEVDPNKLGLIEKDCIISYASENKEDVQIWINGVLATMKLLKSWCN